MGKAKKCIVRIMIVSMMVLGSVAGVSALSTASSCTIKIGDISASTSSVGTSTSANFKFKTYSSSNAPANCEVLAAWTGWPYTVERNAVVGVGSTWSGTETQSKNSNFYCKIFSMYLNNTYAYAYIKAN